MQTFNIFFQKKQSGRCEKHHLLNPRAYISRYSKVGPKEGIDESVFKYIFKVRFLKYVL